ncbi:hypothetical protein BIV25_18950 [Streptomyces sp. MUSC 14]|nr:hypothetical protein BIV25_18950 [Streptomyces sp. MUSC 14]
MCAACPAAAAWVVGRAVRAITRVSAAAVLATSKAAPGPRASVRRPVTATARACPPAGAPVATAVASASRAGGTARSVSPNTVIRCGA